MLGALLAVIIISAGAEGVNSVLKQMCICCMAKKSFWLIRFESMKNGNYYINS